MLNNTIHQEPSLDLMFDSLLSGKAVYHPSEFWKILNKKNIDQLHKDGLQNLKQTIATNYFTWVIGCTNPQFRYLIINISIKNLMVSLKNSFSFKKSSRISFWKQLQLSFFTQMLWKFTEQIDSKQLLSNLSGPLEGNPFSPNLEH